MIEMRWNGKKTGWIVFALIMLIFNLHLFTGSAPSLLVYRPGAFETGQWWRLFTHPLVHVSWYHLILDTTAFSLIWSEMRPGSMVRKCAVGCFSAAGSLWLAISLSPYVTLTGYCGLSGVAHGLMFELGLEWITRFFCSGANKKNQVAVLVTGLLMTVSVGIKAIYEVVTGHVIFSGWHLGDLGTPIVHAHLGGVAGGLAAFAVISMIDLFWVRLKPAHIGNSDQIATTHRQTEFV